MFGVLVLGLVVLLLLDNYYMFYNEYLPAYHAAINLVIYLPLIIAVTFIFLHALDNRSQTRFYLYFASIVGIAVIGVCILYNIIFVFFVFEDPTFHLGTPPEHTQTGGVV